MLNKIWSWFFIIALAATVWRLATGDTRVAADAVNALFDSAQLAAQIALGLVGVLSLWMGLMRLGEQSGMVRLIARVVEPLLRKLMPELPKGDAAFGSVTMNLTANMLGLDNAATPLGLKAMQDLQRHNPIKETASNAQIMFLVLNTSSVTLVPVTIFLYRAQQGAASPADVFLPILLATMTSTIAGLLAVAWVQRLPLLNLTVAAYAGVALTTVGSFVAYLTTLGADAIGEVSTFVGNLILIGLIFLFVLAAIVKKVPVYDAFIEGAKSGFEQSIRLIPYLLAMLLAIALLRASGALDLLLNLLSSFIAAIGWDNRFVDALPTALMKPFSGSGARAMMLETMNHYGVDSFAGRLASIFQGSTETTFYVLAVYFGAVGIRNGRHAVACGLIADMAGIIAAIMVAYWFYG
ncbi:membrane protein [Shewanella mangrovi]|uniref:Membrane protein n=1 Tax=Shewanella mangrovi TaxID=1515746 RepID=A0A094K1S1_9GAMM|nr:nucleoside recognition domain-containing protein [Shewanella mangrovi]KFZ38611.1 membrane protein [Shewanella mangrovi]